MKKRISWLSIFMAIMMVFTLNTTTAFATDTTVEENLSNAPVELNIDNITYSESVDGGMVARFDLVKEVPAEEGDGVSLPSIGWIEVVGWGQMRCRLIPGNGIGYFDWDLYLTNGDFFREVTGTLVLERNNALLPDFNIAKKRVNASYPPSSLSRQAHGSEAFDCPADIDHDMNVRFKWSSFKIKGVTDDYDVTNGRATGTVEDFI